MFIILGYLLFKLKKDLKAAEGGHESYGKKQL